MAYEAFFGIQITTRHLRKYFEFIQTCINFLFLIKLNLKKRNNYQSRSCESIYRRMNHFHWNTVCDDWSNQKKQTVRQAIFEVAPSSSPIFQNFSHKINIQQQQSKSTIKRFYSRPEVSTQRGWIRLGFTKTLQCKKSVSQSVSQLSFWKLLTTGR